MWHQISRTEINRAFSTLMRARFSIKPLTNLLENEFYSLLIEDSFSPLSSETDLFDYFNFDFRQNPLVSYSLTKWPALTQVKLNRRGTRVRDIELTFFK